MRRALFLLEARRALVPVLTIAVAGGLVLAAIERIVVARGADPSTAAKASEVLLLSGIILSGIFAGAQTFAREFKERHHPLLAALPLSPSWTWFILLSANAAAFLVGVAALLLVHPMLVADLEAASRLTTALAVHFYLFVVGTCAVLACRRTLAAIVLGLPLAAWTLFETLSFIPDADALVRAWSPGAVATLGLFLVLSWRFYRRGEFDLPRVRFRAQAVLCASAILTVTLVRWLHPTPLLEMPTAFWTDSRASHDGQVVARWTRTVNGRARIDLASGVSGLPTGSRSELDVRDFAWAPDENVLWAVIGSEPLWRTATLLGSAAGPMALRLSPDGTVRSRHPLPENADNLVPLSGGAAAFVNHREPAVEILVMDGSGRSQSVAVEGRASQARLLPSGDGRAVAFAWQGPLLRAAWICSSGGIEPVETVAPRSKVNHVVPTIVGRRAFASIEDAEIEILRHPLPDGVARGTVVFDRPVSDGADVIFHATPASTSGTDLAVLDPGCACWRTVARGVSPGEHLAMDPRRGVAVYQVASQGRIQPFVYDRVLDRSVPLGPPRASAAIAATLRHEDPFPMSVEPRTALISLSEGAARTLFSYTLGSGRPLALYTRPHPTDLAFDTLFFGLDGRRIVRNEERFEIRFRDGTSRPLRFR